MRYLNTFDYVLCEVDTALRALFVPQTRASNRVVPGATLKEQPMSDAEKRHVTGLMRVNHAGEVCAQALYQSQAITAQLTTVKEQMAKAAMEENDHLAWCEQRLREFNSHPSVLNPIWYTGSLLLGIIAGLAGDRWSLGFVAETERQVTAHLKKHLQSLPRHDLKTEAILAQMQEDEDCHAQAAIDAGAAELPFFIKHMMQFASKLMTQSSYHI